MRPNITCWEAALKQYHKVPDTTLGCINGTYWPHSMVSSILIQVTDYLGRKKMLFLTSLWGVSQPLLSVLKSPNDKLMTSVGN